MTDLTTLAAVRAQLNIADSLTGDDDLISDYVTQASRTIEALTERSFTGTNGTMTYDCCEPTVIGRKLFFDQDVINVYSVVNGDGETVTSSEYRQLPSNHTPKYGIELLPSSNKSWTYDVDWQDAITVAGTLGYCLDANRPADITLAATKLAAWLYQNRDNAEQTVRYADGSSEVPAQAPALVLKILTDGGYMRLGLKT